MRLNICLLYTSYSAQKVADDVTMIRRYYGYRGYADAAVRPDIQEVGIDPRTGYGQRCV